MDATVTDRGVCRIRGAPSSLERTFLYDKRLVASPQGVHSMFVDGPPQGRDAGATATESLYFTSEIAPKTPNEAASMMTPASRTPRVT